MSNNGTLLSSATSLVNSLVLAWQGEENRAVQREVLVFQRERLQYEKEAQRKAAETRRAELQFQATARLREIWTTHETHKIIENWPLRLLPSQYAGDPESGTVPLKALLAYNETLQPMASRLEEALREHFALHFPPTAAHRAVEFLGGAWSGRDAPGEATMRALHRTVGSVPTMILVLERISGVIKVRVAYWGAGARTFSYASIGEVRYSALIADVARRRAFEWRDARERLRRAGTDTAAVKGSVHEHNLRIAQEEEHLRAAGIDPIPLGYEDQYRIQPGFHDALIDDLGAALTLAGTAIADVHFLLHNDARPLLPALFAHRQEPAIRAFLAASASGFRSAYQSLIDQRQTWEPELLLDLARSLVALPETALQHARESMRAWLRLRGVESPSDDDLVPRIEPLVTDADRDYIVALARLLTELGAPDSRLDRNWSAVPAPRRPVQVHRDLSLPDPFAFVRTTKRRRLRAAAEEETS